MVLSKLRYHLSENGRYDSYTIHMLGYPLLVGSIAMGLCFNVLDAKGDNTNLIHACALLMLLLGLACIFMFRGRSRPRASGGIMTIGLMYGLSILIAALPYVIYGFEPENALFEAISGITTTGVSVNHLSQMHRAILIWRAITGWLGGFLFISLFCLYISDFGIPGRYLFSSGSVSVDSDVYKPQLMKIALRYGEVYLASTVLMSVLLIITGTSNLSSISLAMSTVSTTGFMDFHGGLHTLPLMSRVVICVFMFIAMFNFTTTFFALMKRTLKPFSQDNESRYMLPWLVLMSSILFIVLFQHACSPNDAEEFVDFVLVVLSCASTTGFSVLDYSWPSMALIILCVVALVGGSIDSPTGGFKVSRVAMILKIMKNNINDAAFPNEVNAIRIRDVNVSRSLAYGALLTAVLYMLFVVFAIFLMMIDGLDVVSAFYVTVSAITTTGKGLFVLGDLESVDNFIKCVYAALMVIGRLEVVPVIMLLIPEFWRDLFRGKIGIRQRINGRRPRF